MLDVGEATQRVGVMGLADVGRRHLPRTAEGRGGVGVGVIQDVAHFGGGPNRHPAPPLYFRVVL